MNSANFIPRRDRDLHRGRLAADRLRTAGGSAMDAALEHVGIAFNLASIHNRFKERVEHVLRAGTGHPEIRARFRDIVAHVSIAELDLDDTLETLAGWIAYERKVQPILSRAGRGNKLRLMVLTEARLALRWIRRFHGEAFGQIVRELAGERAGAFLQAAE